MSQHPQLSVLLPTLNSMPLLPAHVESMRPWIDLAEEIVVVDSHSTDGTVEYLQQKLAGYPLKFHSRERGLYQSWNYGIQQAADPWLYISTVGDSIERSHLLHLVRLGENTQADVVLSCPKCISDPDCDRPVLEWSIHEILHHAAPSQDFTISSEAAHFYAWWHSRTSALLGSAASNLYRTAHLQKHPFPVEYGTAGDGAWGLLYALHTRFAATAREGSTFRLHAKPYAKEEYHVDNVHERIFALGHAANATFGNWKGKAPFSLPIAETIQARETWSQQYDELKQLRKKHSAWYFRPDVWQKRRQCKRSKKRLDQLVGITYTLLKEKHLSSINLGKPL